MCHLGNLGITVAVIWDMTLFSVVSMCRCFGEIWFIHSQGRLVISGSRTTSLPPHLVQVLSLLTWRASSNTFGPGSVVGIATGYGLVGSRIESRWGAEIFRTRPDRPWGPPSLLYIGYRVFPGGKDRPGRDADPSPPSSAFGHERVELYLYSPYGPYGLYRALVPVQG